MSTKVGKTKLNITNLSQELKDLQWEDINLLAIRLGVSYEAIKKVREENSKIVLRLVAILDIWLKIDTDASWEKVVYSLESIGQNVLAARLKSKYCKTKIAEGAHALLPEQMSPATEAGKLSVYTATYVHRTS